MADIAYKRTAYKHDPEFVENETVVSADPFNTRFHALEVELDAVEVVVGQIDGAIKRTPRVGIVKAFPATPLAAGAQSAVFDVETYDRAGLPADVERVYFVVVVVPDPAAAVPVGHAVLYTPLPGNKMKVSVRFFNPTTTPAQFAFRVMTLASQT